MFQGSQCDNGLSSVHLFVRTTTSFRIQNIDIFFYLAGAILKRIVYSHCWIRLFMSSRRAGFGASMVSYKTWVPWISLAVDRWVLETNLSQFFPSLFSQYFSLGSPRWYVLVWNGRLPYEARTVKLISHWNRWCVGVCIGFDARPTNRSIHRRHRSTSSGQPRECLHGTVRALVGLACVQLRQYVWCQRCQMAICSTSRCHDDDGM